MTFDELRAAFKNRETVFVVRHGRVVESHVQLTTVQLASCVATYLFLHNIDPVVAVPPKRWGFIYKTWQEADDAMKAERLQAKIVGANYQPLRGVSPLAASLEIARLYADFLRQHEKRLMFNGVVTYYFPPRRHRSEAPREFRNELQQEPARITAS